MNLINKILKESTGNNIALSNLFISIDQTEDLEEYDYLVDLLKRNAIRFLDCLEGIFIEDWKETPRGKEIYQLYIEKSETTSNKPKIINDTFFTTYELRANYYAIIKKQELDIENTFKNFLLYHLKKPFKYGLEIDKNSIKISYDKDKGIVRVKFDYILKTANKSNIKGIEQYLKNRYSKLLKKYSLILNE